MSIWTTRDQCVSSCKIIYQIYFLKDWEKDERRKAIFMDCGIHAREWISPAFCQWFVYQVNQLEQSHNSPLIVKSPSLH